MRLSEFNLQQLHWSVHSLSKICMNSSQSLIYRLNVISFISFVGREEAVKSAAATDFVMQIGENSLALHPTLDNLMILLHKYITLEN